MSNLSTNQNYTLFDADNIKQFIINQLNTDGTFIDQKYMGSNLNIFIDIIATMLQQIQFHYNMSATEATFSTSNLYENINKLVSLINYKPNGKQTAILPILFDLTGLSHLVENSTFIIPRYSYVKYNTNYVLKQDVSFTSGSDNIEDILFQGTLTESPKYLATGEDFQIITLKNLKDNTRFITDNFFDVYVREPNGKWNQYSEINTLFDAKSIDKVFERRLNPNNDYEFKFGNNINGYKPVENSEILIVYLISDGTTGEINNNLLKNAQLYFYNSYNFNEIVKDTTTGIFNYSPNYVANSDAANITVSSTGNSTLVTEGETSEIIKTMAPKIFSSQQRLLVANDYINHIIKNYSNFIKDCYVCNNSEYLESYLNYFISIGLNSPNEDYRVLLNQVNFQTSCAFNNVYLFLLPIINTIIDDKVPNYVNTSIKQYIIDGISPIKDFVHNISPMDPIYKAVSFGTVDNADKLLKNYEDTKLVLIKDKTSNFSNDYIISQCETIFKNFFKNVKMGSTIDISSISAEILQIQGIKGLKMVNGDIINDKLTFLIWNPLYETNDFMITQQNIVLSPFMYPYFYDLSNINSKISIINE